MTVAASCQRPPSRADSAGAPNTPDTAARIVPVPSRAFDSATRVVSTSEPTPDIASGIVSITGTSFEKQLVLRSGDSSIYLSAGPSDSAALSRMGDIEVVVAGKRAGKKFQVERFMALSVGGSRVVDGVLRKDGDQLWLETGNDRVRLGNPPTALRSMIGARVWVGGSLDKGPNVYGVIVPAH
jgi:hypothetical protein